MKLKLAIAAIALLCCSVVVHADSGSAVTVIQVNGAFTTPQGEAFAVSYEAALCCSNGSAENFNLVPGTLTYSSSGPLGTFTASASSNWPEGALWTNSSGDQIVLELFRTPPCGTTPDAMCVPDIGPDERFPPGFTNADLNAFANGFFEVIPAGQSFSPGIFGDVKVSFVPEPSTYVMLLAGILALIALRSIYDHSSNPMDYKPMSRPRDREDLMMNRKTLG
jgi:hypothetical protein